MFEAIKELFAGVFEVVEHHGSLFIITPFLDEHNDHIQIAVKAEKDGTFCISNIGEIRHRKIDVYAREDFKILLNIRQFHEGEFFLESAANDLTKNVVRFFMVAAFLSFDWANDRAEKMEEFVRKKV